MLPRSSVCLYLCLTIALCAVSAPTHADQARRVLHDATVVTDAELVRGAEATVFVAVTGAVSLTESQPIAGAEVDLAIAPPPPPSRPSRPSRPSASSSSSSSPAPASAPRGARRLARGRTGSDGNAVLVFRVPALDPGPYRLLVTTRSRNGSNLIDRPVTLADRLHLHLRTDRDVYRPGQTIDWRVTAVGGTDAHPAAGEQVEIVVRDPRETAIWRGRQVVPPSGMIAGGIPLADDLLTGTYELRASVRGVVQTETVQVREFQLPAFEVRLERRREGQRQLAAGGELAARLTARYRYGEPVQGDVAVELVVVPPHGSDIGELVEDAERRRAEAGGERPPIRGRLDRGGAFSFSLRVPPGAEGSQLELRAAVVDGAGRRERAVLAVPPDDASELRVALVPERRTLVRGQRHWFTALTTDGRGRLVPARVQIRTSSSAPRDPGRIRFDSPGAHRVALHAPDAGRWKLRVSAVDASGDAATQAVDLDLVNGPVLRLRRAVVAAGEPVAVVGTWRGARGPVLASLLRDGVPIASALASIDRSGALRAELTPAPGSFGLVAVRLVELGWDRKPGNSSHATEQLSAYLRPAELAVAIAAETRHRPGQRAEIEVAVRDIAGRPVAGAALAASAVDERVLALGRPHPDLTEALRRLDRVEDATSLGLAFADLLPANSAGQSAAERARDDAALRAILEALPLDAPRPGLNVPAEERWDRESARIARAHPKAIERLVAMRGAIGHRDASGRWRYGAELWQLLDRAGWSAADRTTPWREPTTWAYALQIDPDLAFERVAPKVAEARLDGLIRALHVDRSLCRRVLLRRGTAGLRDLVASRAIRANLIVDPWGGALRVERQGGRLHPLLARPTVDVVSAGPDLAFGTADDVRREDVFAPGVGVGGYGTIGHGSGSGFGAGHGSVQVRIGSARDESPVRQRFDETVLWRVGVRTGSAGTARLSVPLGDSITGWKVAVEALTRGGATGAAETRLETFLPLHLDAELPPRLAVGDRYRIPIAVANHSGRDQRLVVAAELGGALRRHATSSALDLAAGATGVAFIDAVAERPGRGTVRLALRTRSPGQPGQPGQLGQLGRPAGPTAAVDRVERTIAVDPPGELARALHTGDVVDGDGSLAFDAPAPGVAAAGSMGGVVRLFRGAADQARDGLEGMLQEPHGCFEQTSSTTYPNLLVLRLLQGAPSMAAARARARAMVGRGYQRLLSYEVKGGGFSWFGEQPAHQLLTAYGLMEFVDMARVYPVDPALIARTRAWLVGKQGRDGSWRADRGSLETVSAVDGPLATTAFIAWALAESGTRGRALDRALAYLRAHRAALARSPYLLALWAASESARPGRRNPALPLLLRAGQPTDGGLAFRAGGATLLHARGNSADVQVTALAASALSRGGRAAEAHRALDWLWQARSPTYGWGTTHSTVLALRAAALAAPSAPTAGILRARLDGRPIGAIDLASIDVPSLRLPAALSPGRHRLTFDGDAAGVLRADLRLAWRERQAPRAHDAGLAVALRAPSAPIALGGRPAFTATIRNLTRDAVAMPTAVLPVPPGFSADPSSIAALERTAGVSRVEDQGDRLEVYLLTLAPGASVSLTYRLDASAECDVLQRPAAAYAFYSPELRGRSAAQRLRVVRGAPPPRAAAAPRLRSPPREVWW